MSSRTPSECITLATDESANEEDRSQAIRELKTANECDELAALARRDGLEDRYRREAIDALATPQCDSTLKEIADANSLSEDLRNLARDKMDEVGGARSPGDR